MNTFFYSGVSALLLLSACNNTPKVDETVPAIDSAITTTQNTEMKDFSAYYEGSIDNNYAITMQVTKIGTSIKGSYSYKNKGIAIELNGTIDSKGRIEMSEKSKDKITGTFNGQLANDVFSGEWSNADSSKKMPFNLRQTAISSLYSKGDVLSYAIGEYHLQSISGNAGANAMFDTYLENGKWHSESSVNIGGQREGSVSELTKKDKDLLEHLRIVVADDRSVHLYAGLVELFNSPYKASGMDYRVSEQDKTKMNEKIAALSADSCKKNDAYVLLANDKINYTEILKGDFGIIAEDNLILTYFPGTNTFELEIFAQQCCDSNVLSFVKK